MRIRIGSKVSLLFGLLIGAVVTFMAISGATVFRERMRGKERETWLAIYHAEARRFLATKKEAPRSVEELIEFSKSTGYSIPWAPLQDGYIPPVSIYVRQRPGAKLLSRAGRFIG